MSGGGSGPIADMMSRMNAPQQTPGNPTGVDYTPVAKPNYYTPSYASQTATPFLQSVMAQHSPQMLQNTNLGLPSLQSMFNMPQGNAPYQSGIQQLSSMAPYVGSTYRPDMSGIAANLKNVAPPVTYEQMHPTPPTPPTPPDSGSGGGGDGGGDGGGE